MTAINFPVTTSTGYVFTFGDRTWVWTGGANGFWKAISTTIGYTGSTGYTGSKGIKGDSGSTTNPWFSTSTNYTASDGDRIIADNKFGSFSISLPAIASVGAYIQITDGNDLSNGDPVSILRNGNTIENLTEDINLDLKGSTFEFVYNGSTWQVTSTTGPRGFVGYTGSLGGNNITLQQPGKLVTYTGTARWYSPTDSLIKSVTPRVRTSADLPISLSLLKNGTALFSQTIPAQATTTATNTTTYTLSTGDYLTVNVLSVGTGAQTGEDLYVQVLYQPI